MLAEVGFAYGVHAGPGCAGGSEHAYPVQDMDEDDDVESGG